MKIEVWSDFVCPFCYIGKRRLEHALNKFPHRNQVEVVYKSFELDPYSETNYDELIHESLAKKYGVSEEEAKRMNESVIAQAKTVGLNYNFDSMTPTNTFRAHRLAKFAEKQGKLAEMTERLLQAHFLESKRIDEVDVLASLAEEVGLLRNEAIEVVSGDLFAELVREDEREAQTIGVRGVPFFVINQKYAISGAQPEQVFMNALEKVWEEENQKSPLQTLATDESGANCSADGCEIPEK